MGRRPAATPPCTRTATSTTSSAPRCSRRSRRRGLARGPGRRPRGRRPPLRPLHPDRRLQRGHQPAAVPGARAAVADRVPPARRHLPRPPRRRGRRHRLRAAPRPRRDRRPHLGVGARAQGAVHRRPDHLVHAQRRQPAEGAALRRGLGGRAARRWPPSAPRCCCPATASRWRAPTRCAMVLVDTADLLEASTTRPSR